MRKFVLAGITAAAMAASPVFAANEIELLNSPCSLSTTGCLFSGNITAGTTQETQDVYNAAQNPDITLNFLFKTDDTYSDLGDLSGTWSLPGFVVDYIAVKAGNQFRLYSVTPGDFSWSTEGLVNPKNPDVQLGLSHLAFFGSAAVPEPATWAMMIAGFGLTGAAMRRRKTKVAVTYA